MSASQTCPLLNPEARTCFSRGRNAVEYQNPNHKPCLVSKPKPFSIRMLVSKPKPFSIQNVSINNQTVNPGPRSAEGGIKKQYPSSIKTQTVQYQNSKRLVSKRKELSIKTQTVNPGPHSAEGGMRLKRRRHSETSSLLLLQPKPWTYPI